MNKHLLIYSSEINDMRQRGTHLGDIATILVCDIQTIENTINFFGPEPLDHGDTSLVEPVTPLPVEDIMLLKGMGYSWQEALHCYGCCIGKIVLQSDSLYRLLDTIGLNGSKGTLRYPEMSIAKLAIDNRCVLDEAEEAGISVLDVLNSFNVEEAQMFLNH